MKIKNVEIAPGESRQIHLKIARLPTHTTIELPIYVFRSTEPGPVLLFSAGLHGDETNGIEIVRRLISQDLINPLRGSVIAIPIVNIYGFLQSARYLPDGKDLNRSFPGHKTGSLARRVAYALMNEIVPHIDYGIDFHTGGANLNNFPQVRCDMREEQNVQLAEWFSAPLTLDSKMIDKSLRKSAHRLGKQIIVYEGGESLRFDELAIQEGINGTLRFMKALDMTAEAPAPSRQNMIMKHTIWVRAKSSGMFHPVVKPGDAVLKNQLLGTITDPYGDYVYRVKAQSKGWIISLNYMPVVNQGDALIHFGKP